FYRAGKSGEENRYALLVPWRIALTQLLHDFRISEPRRNVAAFVEPLAQFRSGNVQHASALGNFIVGNITVFILQINHHLEWDHGHAHLFLMFLEKFLSVIRPVEWLAALVLARTRMVAAYNEVRATVVLADERMPERFARPAHAHSQRQHGKLHRSRRIFRQQ